MHTLQQELDILKSKSARFEKILEKLPKAMFAHLDYIGPNDILISNYLTKVDKIEVYAPQSYVNTRVVLHAIQFVEDIPVYSVGVDFASFNYSNNYVTVCNALVPQFPNVNVKRSSNLRFSSYIDELRGLRVSDNTIKKIEMYVYNKYLKQALVDADFAAEDYIPQTFKKLLIFNS